MIFQFFRNLILHTNYHFALPIALLALSSCTGGLKQVSVDQGGMRVNPGESLSLNVGGIQELGVQNYRVTLRTVGSDFRNLTPFHDVTGLVQGAISEGKSDIDLILPKSVTPARPYLVVVELLDIQDFLIDAVFTGTTATRPDVNSTLAYSLLESFHSDQNPRPINGYSNGQFSGLKELIRSKTALMISQSEHLSLSNIPFDKLMRFFKNGMAFNQGFLELAANSGVKFRAQPDSMRVVPGVSQIDTPENSLDSCFKGFCYKYPTSFEVQTANGSWIPAPQLPFKQNSNNPSQILQGSAVPDPSLSLNAMEGPGTPEAPKIEVSATGYDQDNDYFEKSVQVRYQPRKLPVSLTQRPGFNVDKQEESPVDLSILGTNSYDRADRYTLQSIGYHEALDLDSINPDVFPECSTPGNCDTANRDVFFMYTDGMAWVPYHWKFRYRDVGRPPVFIRDSNQKINSTYFNAAIQSTYQDDPNPLTPEWKVHDSHCETDSLATPPNGPVDYYQQIQSRSDGPWSCAFKVTDPDLIEDPNGSLDEIHFEVSADDFTQIYFGAKLDSTNSSSFSQLPVDLPKLFNNGITYPFMNPMGVSKGAPTLISPPLAPASATSLIRMRAMTDLQGEAECGGFKRCSAGLVQVVIDNAVKVAAEQQTNQTFSYMISAYDARSGGRSTNQTVSRGILFKPKAPLLINYSNLNAPAGSRNIEDIILDQDQKEIHARHDIHLSEIMSLARHANSTNPKDIGFDPQELLGTANRIAFQVPDAASNPVEMSPYLTQPRTLCASPDAVDFYTEQGAAAKDNGLNCRGAYDLAFNLQETISGSPGHLIKLGNSLRMLDSGTYTYPREYDFACNLEENNTGRDASGQIVWDQRSASSGYYSENLPQGAPASRVQSSLGGWTFEINVIDPENIDLRSGEPSDPVFTNAVTDLASADNLYFCIPPKPNRSSLYYETYTSTNTATPNGIDPDSCTQWSKTPPIELQPIPVYYNGSDINGPKIRKFVYHRLRARWVPTDQGLARKIGNPDPPGVIRNAFKTFKLHGNVFLNKSDTRDLTEPRIVDDFTVTGSAPISFAAEKKEMRPCLNGTFGGVDQIITPENIVNVRTFKVADTNHTNSTNLNSYGAISGRYEAEWELLGNRTLDQFEFLKFVPYLGDCTAQETRNVSTASIVYDFPVVSGASSYSIYMRDPAVPGATWVSQGNIQSPPFTLSDVPSFASREFKHLPNLQPPLSGVESAPLMLQANPMPATVGATANYPRASIFYSSSVDGSKPKMRFRSLLNNAPNIFNPNTSGNFCYQYSPLPVTSPNGTLTGVVKFTRSNPANQTQIILNSPWIEKCTGHKTLVMEPEYKSMVVGSSTTGPDCAFMLNQTIATFQGLGSGDASGSTDIEAKLVFKIDPELPEFGKLNTPNPNPPVLAQLYNLFWFPGLYAAEVLATIPRTNGLVNTYYVPDVNAVSGLFFKTYPINTFRYDLDSNSPTFGRSTYVGYQVSPKTDSVLEFNKNTGPIPEYTIPDETKEYNLALRGVDFDAKLVAVSTAAPSPDLAASPAPLSYFRNRPSSDGLNTTVQIFSWPPLPGSGATRTVEFPITATDMAIGRPEIDPYDVLGFVLATPSPAPAAFPVNPPNLQGWGVRSDCNSTPPQFPLASLLRLDTLSDYKKCKVSWSQREQDAGKVFNYLIQVQDNIGADATVTPKLLGLGAKHPVSTMSNTLVFRYDPLPQGISQVNGTSPSVRFTVDAPDGPVAGTTMDDTIPSCATSNICYRNRVWNSVPSTNCNQTTRACSVNVMDQYKLHFIEVTRQTRTISTGVTSAYVQAFEIQPRPSVPQDSQPLTNGPIDLFNLQIFSLEHNNPPFFTDSAGTALSNAIYSGSATGNWSAISLPAPCSSGSGGSFQCNLRVNNGDTLWNAPASASALPTPYELQERSTPYTDFKINVKDIATLNDLKTLTITQPTQVLILDGPNAGLTYTVPSFTNSSLMNWRVTGSLGTASASFQWAPTDQEAHLLSNTGGFLIPIKVTDRSYNPQPSETNFPSQFIVPSKESTIWIWCKLSVFNNIPVVQYLVPPSTWRDLSNATIELNTGSTSTLTVRVRDSDAARYRFVASERSRSFFPASPFSGSASSFMTAGTPAAPLGDPNETSPTAVVQNLVLTANPTNSNLGNYNATISVQDPGDPSLGLAINANTDAPPRARPATPVTSVSFNVNVVGRPFFIVPQVSSPPSSTPARAYSLRGNGIFSTFDYPLALFISRLSDRDLPGQTNKPHFVGIQIKPALMPATTVANTATAKGFRVNQDYVLKGRFDGSDASGDRTVALGAVPISNTASLGCTATAQTTTMNDASILSSSSIAVSLKRIKDTGEVEYCNLTQTNANNLLSQASLTHTLVDGSSTQPFASSANASFGNARLNRTLLATSLSAVNSEFLDFTKRCTEFCPGSPVGNGGFTLTGDEVTGYSNPSSSFSPSLVYGPNSSGRGGSFVLNEQNEVIKTYTDNLPQTNTVMNSFVTKGEQLSFSVQLGSAPLANGIHARWYVNGCLKKSEPVPVTLNGPPPSLSFSMAVPTTGAGLNNDCSGQYSRTETGGGFLGMNRSIRFDQSGGYLGDLIIRLVLANSSEPISSTTDGSSSKTYAFHLNVVNTIPRIMTETDQRLRAVPVSVSASNVNVSTANSPNAIPSKFIMPFDSGTTSLFSYVGLNNTLSGTAAGNPYGAGTSLHVREFTLDGSAGGPFRRDVLCSGYSYLASGDPNQFMFGLDASGGLNNLKIATSVYGKEGLIGDAYKTGSGSILGNRNTACWFSFSSMTPALAGSSLDSTGEGAGRILAFSPLRLGSRGATMWTPPSASSTSVVEPFLIEGTLARTRFWMNSNAMASAPSIFQTTPSMLANYPNNIITKSMVEPGTNRLIQLVGLKADQFSGFNGGVMVSNLSTSNGSTLNASLELEVPFGQGGCTFEGADKTYPIDGIYHSAEDILFMVAIELPDSGAAVGKLVEIRNFLNPTGSAPRTCRLAGAILTPSRTMKNHNPSNLRLTLDARTGVLWGVTAGNDSSVGQLFSYDYKSRRPIYTLTLDYQPGPVLFSPLINGVHLFYPGVGTKVPALFRVW
jgi:hypothetical protein